jgi:hypothetical protein
MESRQRRDKRTEDLIFLCFVMNCGSANRWTLIALEFKTMLC